LNAPSAQPLVTVATAVYNGERFLAEAAESVLRQTYPNWRYYIIDNCSTDRTPEIGREIASRDTRVQYRRCEDFVDVNESYSRGFAAVDADASYLKIVDSDDWIYPECLERMVALAESEPAVGMVSAYRLNDARGATRVDQVNLPYTQSTIDGREMIARSLVSPVSILGPPTALLWRADLVRARQPFFDAKFRHADDDANFWTLMQSRYGLVHQVLTYSRGHGASETSLSDRLAAYAPERLRMIIRYGPQVLSEEKYQKLLREKIDEFLAYHRRLFVWWHLKRHFRKAWRPEVQARREFHRQEVEWMAEEAPGSPEVQRMARIARFLLR
jgi:glycosyltransferase involved in cell wall biosynthesis